MPHTQRHNLTIHRRSQMLPWCGATSISRERPPSPAPACTDRAIVLVIAMAQVLIRRGGLIHYVKLGYRLTAWLSTGKRGGAWKLLTARLSRR